MNSSHASVLVKTVEKTHAWLEELRGELGGSEQEAYRALRATLQALRMCLPLNEVAGLSAQLPVLVRGMFFEGWQPAKETLRLRQREFLERVQERYGKDPVDTREVVAAVFKVLQRHVTRGEVEGVEQVLPEALRGLWSAPEAEADAPRAPMMEHAVGQFMSRDVLTVRDDAPLQEALELMGGATVRHLLVLAARAFDERPIHTRAVAGILSNRDALNVMRRHPDSVVRLEWLLVRDVMTRMPLVTVLPTASLREAAVLMHEKALSALPVVEEERVVGILSSDDLLFAGSLESAPAPRHVGEGSHVSG